MFLLFTVYEKQALESTRERVGRVHNFSHTCGTVMTTTQKQHNQSNLINLTNARKRKRRYDVTAHSRTTQQLYTNTCPSERRHCVTTYDVIFCLNCNNTPQERTDRQHRRFLLKDAKAHLSQLALTQQALYFAQFTS